MKHVCVLIALSACSSVAMADYVIDPFTQDPHGVAYSGDNSESRYTIPFTSGVPTAWMRQTYFQVSTYGGSAVALASTVGGGQMSMEWTLSAPGGSSALALAATGLSYSFSGVSLGSSSVLSYAGSGSFTGSYTTAEVFIQARDGSGDVAGWWVPFTPGAFTGLQLDLYSTPDYVQPGFDPSTLSDVSLQFAFVMNSPSADSFGTGSIVVSNLRFVPTPGAAALIGLGGLAAMRRRR